MAAFSLPFFHSQMTDNEPQRDDRLPRKRPWTRLNLSTYVVLLLAAAVLALANLPGDEVFPPDVLSDGKYGPHFELDSELHHGWPLTYLRRWPDVVRTPSGDYVVPQQTYWSLTSNVLQVRFGSLAVNIVLAIGLSVLAAFLYEAWRRRRRRIYQFHLIDLAVAVVVVSLACSWLTVTAREHHRELEALERLEVDQEGVAWQRAGPSWLRQLAGDRPFASFDRVIDIWHSRPEDLGSFPHLKRLSFFGSQDSVDFQDFPELVAIDASHWGFDYSDLTRLRHPEKLAGMNLYDAGITDEEMVHLRNVPNLKNLCLSSNSIGDAGVAHLAVMSEIRILDLSGAEVTDAGLAHLAGLTTLEELRLSQTQVGDAGLAHLTGLSNLKRITLTTGVSAAGLAHLANLTGLEELDVNWRKATAAGLVHVRGLSNLWDLDLRGTDVTDADLVHLSGLRGLRFLSVRDTGVSDAGLKHLAGLANLEYLDLSGASITDAGLAHLAEMTNLGVLLLDGTRVTGSGLKRLSRLPALRRLSLTNTPTTDAALKHLEELAHLDCLQLSGTDISDAGLVHLATLGNLKVLDLRDTQVSQQGIQRLQRTLPNCDFIGQPGSRAGFF